MPLAERCYQNYVRNAGRASKGAHGGGGTGPPLWRPVVYDDFGFSEIERSGLIQRTWEAPDSIPEYLLADDVGHIDCDYTQFHKPESGEVKVGRGGAGVGVGRVSVQGRRGAMEPRGGKSPGPGFVLFSPPTSMDGTSWSSVVQGEARTARGYLNLPDCEPRRAAGRGPPRMRRVARGVCCTRTTRKASFWLIHRPRSRSRQHVTRTRLTGNGKVPSKLRFQSDFFFTLLFVPPPSRQ